MMNSQSSCCACQHHILRFVPLRPELKPLDYCDASGNPIDPDWLTVTHNQLGKECHGGAEGYSLEYRTNDGSVITWEEFASLDHALQAADKWQHIALHEWQTCMIEDRDDVSMPWSNPTQHNE